MSLSNDQRKVIKSIALYTLANIIVFPLFHWRKGDFNWSDTLLYWALITAVNIVIALLFKKGRFRMCWTPGPRYRRRHRNHLF